MYYFLEENIAITQEQLNFLKVSEDWAFLESCPKDFNIMDVAKTQGKIYYDLVCCAIDQKDLKFLKHILKQGYFIKTLQKEKEEIFKFNNTIKGFVSYVGKKYDKDILNFLLEENNKISALAIFKIIMKQKNMSFFNKIKSYINIYKCNNVKIKIQETEIIQNLIESENLLALKDLKGKLQCLKYNEIYYYLTDVKNEDIIDYIFSLNIKGNDYYNELALNLLVHNTKRFIKFYEQMDMPELSGLLLSQIIETQNIELLQYLYNENKLSLVYEKNIIHDIVYHAIFKNKIQALKTLLSFWHYDLSDYEKIKNKYEFKVNQDLEVFIIYYREKQQLKKKLEIKLNNPVKKVLIKI